MCGGCGSTSKTLKSFQNLKIIDKRRPNLVVVVTWAAALRGDILEIQKRKKGERSYEVVPLTREISL